MSKSRRPTRSCRARRGRRTGRPRFGQCRLSDLRLQESSSSEGTLPKMPAIDWEPLRAFRRTGTGRCRGPLAIAGRRALRGRRRDGSNNHCRKRAGTIEGHEDQRDAAITFTGEALAALAIGLGLVRGDEEDDDLQGRVLDAIARGGASPPTAIVREEVPRNGPTPPFQEVDLAGSRGYRRAAAEELARPSATGLPRSTRSPPRTGSTAGAWNRHIRVDARSSASRR